MNYQLSKYQEIPGWLLREAELEEKIYEYDLDTQKKDLILVGNKEAGFIAFSQEEDYWKTSIIYIVDSFRHQGLASQVLTDFYRNKKGKALINIHNLGSQKAFSKAGFTKSGEIIKKKITYNLYSKET